MPPDHHAQRIVDDLAAQIAQIADDRSLLDLGNFAAREQARYVLVEHLIPHLDALIVGAAKGPKQQIRAVKRQAIATRLRLEQAHAEFVARLRAQIQAAVASPAMCWQLLTDYAAPPMHEHWDDPPRYDQLDTLVDGLLAVEEMPRARRRLEREMVGYQPTPARLVLDLVRRLHLGTEDVFYDLGAGVGRVALLVGLLSPAQVIGVEYEPAYVDMAQQCAQRLGMTRAHFLTADAQDLAYSDGTVFYLYTPFKGTILERVLARLQAVAQQRPIRVCTYGPGTLEVRDQSWFASSDPWEPDMDRPTIYRSR